VSTGNIRHSIRSGAYATSNAEVVTVKNGRQEYVILYNTTYQGVVIVTVLLCTPVDVHQNN